MATFLSLETWRGRLEDQGHNITESAINPGTGFALWPNADTILTVAVDPDETLYQQYRKRFFLCEPESEKVFRAMDCPEPHRSRWMKLVDRQPAGYWQDFLAGPGAWTLSRLACFREVVAWAERGLAWETLEDPIYRGWGMEIPADAAPLFSALRGAESHRPLVFPVEDERFADAVAACFLFGSVALHDCYLADVQGAEVYLAHHHDKVVVSILNPQMHQALVQELDEMSWLFTDVSDYE